MVLTLYKFDLSPPVRSVLMILDHLKLPVEMIDVDFTKGEQLTEEFKKINPQHTVPTLVDDDFILADSHAICTYLLNKYGKDDSIYPTDPKQRAIVEQRLHFDSGILFPVAKNAFGQIFFQGANKVSDDTRNKIIAAYELIDKYCSQTWLAGEQFTLADICCGSTISTLDVIVPIDAKYPNLNAWYRRCLELDIYKKNNAPGDKKLREEYKSKVA